MLSFIKPWIPAAYRDLLDFISPAAFQVIDWQTAVSDLAKVSSGAILGNDGRPALMEALDEYLPDTITLQHEKGNTDYDHQVLGQTILETYFSQFLCAQGLFLDLRLKNFSSHEDGFFFHPSDLIYRFSDDFRTGMLNTYKGFYLSDEELLKNGMIQSGLLPADSEEMLFSETRELLFSHFDTADENPIAFDLGKFRKSFHDLFMHLKKHRIQLPADFLFLGFYLVTLYHGLEDLGEEFYVKDCFLAAIE